MTRASISLSPPNDDWIQSQIESKEFSSRSEVLNDLVRRARREQAEFDYIRAKLIRAEKGGLVDKTPEEMLAGFKEKARSHGKL